MINVLHVKYIKLKRKYKDYKDLPLKYDLDYK